MGHRRLTRPTVLKISSHPESVIHGVADERAVVGADVDVVHGAIRETAQTIKAFAVEEGQDVADTALYPNYAFFDTPLAELYGANVPRLQAIKKAVDPQNVMGLAGGFKL